MAGGGRISGRCGKAGRDAGRRLGGLHGMMAGAMTSYLREVGASRGAGYKYKRAGELLEVVGWH